MRAVSENRFLSEGYPELEKIGVSHYRLAQETKSRVPEILECLGRLIDLSTGSRSVVVVGCGPNAWSVKALLECGYDAVGVEPLAESARAAVEFLGEPGRVWQARAERLPFADDSQRIILMESVLEHVDSPVRSVAEAYRVLVPGGVLYIYTTNRLKFSLTGKNDEFRVRFYNWFPRIVKECYVYEHLQHDPSLANYAVRPAVHWFTFAELCDLGRRVGFGRFYSLLDLVETDSPSIQRSVLRRWLFRKVRRSPWLRALALTQTGSSIFMLKRPN